MVLISIFWVKFNWNNYIFRCHCCLVFSKRCFFARFQDCDNLWWDAFTTEFFEDDAMLTITFCLEDGPKRYSKKQFLYLLKWCLFLLWFHILVYGSDRILCCLQQSAGRWFLDTLEVFLREAPLSSSTFWSIQKSPSIVTLCPWTATNAPWWPRMANPCSHRYSHLCWSMTAALVWPRSRLTLCPLILRFVSKAGCTWSSCLTTWWGSKRGTSVSDNTEKSFPGAFWLCMWVLKDHYVESRVRMYA